MEGFKKQITAFGYVMESHIINKDGFSYLVVIWYEVMNHEEYLEGSWTDDVPLSFRSMTGMPSVCGESPQGA